MSSLPESKSRFENNNRSPGHIIIIIIWRSLLYLVLFRISANVSSLLHSDFSCLLSPTLISHSVSVSVSLFVSILFPLLSLKEPAMSTPVDWYHFSYRISFLHPLEIFLFSFQQNRETFASFTSMYLFRKMLVWKTLYQTLVFPLHHHNLMKGRRKEILNLLFSQS